MNVTENTVSRSSASSYLGVRGRDRLSATALIQPSAINYGVPQVRSGWLELVSTYSVGAIVAVSLHAGIFVFGSKGTKPKAEVTQEKVITFTMPLKLEPEDEPVPDDEVLPNEVASDALEGFAPPQLVDVPQVALESSFTQTIQVVQTESNFTGMRVLPHHFGQGGSGLGNGKKIFEMAALDQKPQLVHPVRPVYPPELKRGFVQGEVNVTFVVNASGEVVDVTVLNSTNRAFELNAVKAVRQWKFKPGRKAGFAVSTRMELPLEFKLDR